MAPIKPQGNVYYPSLADCFSGEQQLLSWEAAYSALCDPETASTSEVLRTFLSDPNTTSILVNPFSPFPPPDQKSKNKFETDTAPINVTTSSTGDYNIDEIKADSLWLSQQTKIDEPAALRIVILEWQGRPAAQLLGGFTEEESISVQEAAGITNLGASTFVANSSILAAPGGAGSDTSAKFNSADQRKLRLLNIYLSERIYILRISQILISWGAAEDLRSKYGADYRVCDEWLESIGRTIAKMQLSTGNSNEDAPFLSKCLKAIDAALENLEQGSKWTVPESIEETIEEKWRIAQATELVHILHLTFVHVDLFTPKFVPASIMLAWFESMANRNFFVGFQLPLPSQQPLVQLIHLLISLICLAILKVHIVIEDVDTDGYKAWDKSFYVLNGTLIEEVTNTFGYAARDLGSHPGTPAAFAWSVITFRLTAESGGLALEGNSDSLQQQTPLADAMHYLTRVQENEFFGKKMPYAALAEACSNHNVFDLIAQLIKVGMSAFGTNVDRITRDRMRVHQLDLLQASLASEVVTYSPEIILVAHTILAGNRTFWDWVDNTDESHADPITSIFLQDRAVLRPALLGEAQLRYPYETVPLLKFSSVLTRGEKSGHDGIPDVASILLDSKTLMQRLPAGFLSYNLIREEENANFIALGADLPQFSASLPSKSLGTQRRQFGLARHAGSSDSIIIPRGTEGRIVDDTAQPYVAVWHYSHSALKFLVTLLSTCMVGSGQVEYASQESTSMENATEIIGFFADLLNSSIRASKKLGDGGTCSTELLEALHIGTEEVHDTVKIVLAIFEQELLNQCQQPGTEGSMELLVNCTHFIYALITISPARVWPWLARSRLLESDGNGGSLASILIGTEMVTGRYDFLIGCIRIFQALVEDTIDRSVARKAPTRAVARFGVAPTSGSGTSEKVISSTLITFGRTLASIFESALSWKFARVEDRLLINTGLMEGFTTIFSYAYGVDDSPKVSEKLSGLLAPIAEYLADLFMSNTENDLPTNPILASLLSATDLQELSILTSSMDLWSRQTRAALRFSNTIIQVAIMLNRPWTHLEQQLFKATPLLARLYATSDAYKSSVVLLFESLVRGALRSVELPAPGAKSEKSTEPPSLLGHLGRQTAKNFLSILSLLDKPLKIIDIQTNVWNLLAAVVGCRQQWFALYLLTGTTPRESVRSKSTTSDPSKGKALLTYALDELSNIDITKPRKTVAMLEFVSQAQNNWSWAMAGLRQHKGFIKGLLHFLKHIKEQEPKTEADIIRRSYENKIASVICEILAMYLHSYRQIGDFSALKEVISSLNYLERCALQLPSYNTSLHTNLRRNFESKFPGCPLSSFKRTSLRPAQFGHSYFYDIELADRLLGFNSSWKNHRGGGFHDEVVRANINLGLVESQVKLLQKWQILAVELSNSVTRDSRLPKILANIIRQCMVANSESVLPEALFGQLMITRAELSFALLQKMVNVNIEDDSLPVARRLMVVIWTAIRACTADFDNVFSSDHVHYYRLLLRILFLSLNFHRESKSTEEQDFRMSYRASIPAKENRLVEPISTQLLEILQEVVAKGFRSLANQLHSDPDTVAPADFALITAILQLVLRIPEMLNWHGQVALVFANSNTIRYAASLFSWSDRLAIESSNTPGDPIYGELSLLFLLSLSSMHAMAEHMAVENLLSQLNTANIMNYYRRPQGMGPFNPPHRIFSIWSRGLLPLLLNLLRAIGHPVAAEIATFLNQFPDQLKRASNALNTRNNAKITLGQASEIHSLALIWYMIEQYRTMGPAIGIQANDIPVLDWEADVVRDDLDGALAQKGSLRSRIFPGDEREVEMSGRRAKGANGTSTPDGETELEQRVIEELEAAGQVLGVGAGGSQTG